MSQSVLGSFSKLPHSLSKEQTTMNVGEKSEFSSIVPLPKKKRADEVNLFRFREYLNGYMVPPRNDRPTESPFDRALRGGTLMKTLSSNSKCNTASPDGHRCCGKGR